MLGSSQSAELAGVEQSFFEIFLIGKNMDSHGIKIKETPTDIFTKVMLC